ncbi:MAG: thioesterase family protein [Micavibrio sp.]
MNLYFRVFLVWLQALFGPKNPDLLIPGRVRLRVYPNDLDINLHMNNGRYLTILDLGRFHLILRTGLLHDVVKRKYAPVLASAQIRFRLPLLPFRRFDLETRLLCWDEKWIYMEQRFLLVDGEKSGAVAAIALVKGSFYDPATKATVPTDTLLGHIGFRQPSPQFPAYLQDWIRAEDSLKSLTA